MAGRDLISSTDQVEIWAALLGLPADDDVSADWAYPRLPLHCVERYAEYRNSVSRPPVRISIPSFVGPVRRRSASGLITTASTAMIAPPLLSRFRRFTRRRLGIHFPCGPLGLRLLWHFQGRLSLFFGVLNDRFRLHLRIGRRSSMASTRPTNWIRSSLILHLLGHSPNQFHQ